MENATALGFFDFFSRPERVNSALYSDQLGASVGGDQITRKYQMLFSDAFGHHIDVFLDTPPSLELQIDDHRRFISADSLTSYFLDFLYKIPHIYENPNSTFGEGDIIDYPSFLKSVSDTPITGTPGTVEALGSNRLSFLIGETGSGKTLLLCKVIRDLIRKQANQTPGESLLVPIYFDFETEMRSPSGQLLDVEGHLYGRLCSSLLTTLQRFSLLRDRSTNVISAAKLDYGNAEAKLIALIQTAQAVGLRPLLILDNIDGYHYFYSKYSFFEQYRGQQIRSIQANVGALTSALTSGQRLGLLGMSVLIAARRYVYSEYMHTVNPEISLEYSGSVYQLETAGEVDVVESRMALFEKAITTIESNPKLRIYGEYYKHTLERLSMLFGLNEASATLRSPSGSHSQAIIKVVRELCHHGNRGLVTFFSNLRLDYRAQADLIERFLWDKPHTLALLYIADLRKRYSQARGHFPNLFLVDGRVQANAEFPDAHRPHMHTYWLKYLILSYINVHDGVATERELQRLFVGSGNFDETIFRLALGSLATSREFGCLEPDPGGHLIPGSIHITNRGRALVSRWRGYNTRLCFSFDYLQLVVDDFLMSYPRAMQKEIYDPRIDLGYLFADDATYGRANRDYLAKKMKNVIGLVRVLKESYFQEEALRRPLFVKLRDQSPGVPVDFRDVEVSLFDQFERITAGWKDAGAVIRDLEEFSKKLDRDGTLNSELTRYFMNKAPVEE